MCLKKNHGWSHPFSVLITFIDPSKNYLFFPLQCYRSCNKFGRQSWLIAMIIITEFLIVVKFDMETISKPLPQHIALFWIVGALGLMFFTFWKFFIYRDVKNDVLVEEKKETNGVKNGNGKHKAANVNGNGAAARARLRKEK